MSNKCKIYYGTVVNEDGDNWAKLGSHEVEPIKMEGREPIIGKSPEFCCTGFEKAWQSRWLLYFSSDSNRGQIEIKLRSNGPGLQQDLKVCFCPFCGAKIILLENLKLRVMQTTRTVKSYYMEEAV